jgi:hypothetical protein
MKEGAAYWKMLTFTALKKKNHGLDNQLQPD